MWMIWLQLYRIVDKTVVWLMGKEQKDEFQLLVFSY